MTTMAANFVSSQFLANSLVLPVMQAQSSLATAMTEESTGQYADLGLQLGEQSGCELSLKEQVGLLQTLTSNNSIVSTNLSTAQSALSAISSGAQTTLNDLTTWTPGANSGASLQNMGQSALQSLIASANTTSGDQYVFGGINSAVAPMADYYSTPPSAAKTAIDQAFQTAFGVLPSDPAAANISAGAMFRHGAQRALPRRRSSRCRSSRFSPISDSRGMLAVEGPVVCRFLDAGMTKGVSYSGGRRPKSAKARSRGKFGAGWAASAMGI